MLGAGTTTWSSLSTSSYIAFLALNPWTNWADVLNGSNDDSQWVILALWKMADYVGAHGGDTTPYMTAADTIYQEIAGQWDDTCGGGVWWSTAHTYKNAITNHLFLLTSAEGFLRNNNQEYLTNANNAWSWCMLSLFLRNSHNANRGDSKQLWDAKCSGPLE